MRAVAATRYVTPLREGGSLPGLVEADDDGLYVLKFRGAGRTEGARRRGRRGRARPGARLPVPELVLVELDPAIGRAEPDPEIQDLLVASGGTNLGVDFLPGALPFSPAAGPPPDPELAAAIVWLDALVTNVDRTAQNPNLLWWHRRLWLIDHGAALYWHHAPAAPVDAAAPFAAIGDHVLLPYASSVDDADARLAPLVSEGSCGRSPGACRPSGSTDRIRRCTPSTSAGGSNRRAASHRRPSVPAASPFSYAVCRLVPRVERGERINVGVIVFCRPLQYLEARTALDEERALVLWPELDVESVRAHLSAIERIAAGDAAAGPIAALDTTARFHWLVSPSSTIIQPSEVHTGLCDTPADELEKLFRELVLA